METILTHIHIQWTSKVPAVDWVEGGDSRRAGPSRTMIQDVQLEVGHFYVPTNNSNGTTLQRFVTLLYIRIESNLLHVRFPVLSMVITFDTIAHFCGKPSICSNRFWACKAPPELRTDLRPYSNSEQVSCSEEERDTGIQRNLPARGVDTIRPRDISEKDEVENHQPYTLMQGFYGVSSWHQIL